MTDSRPFIVISTPASVPGRTTRSALDQLERPFTDYDRARWGTSSRDTHITDERRRYPGAFGTAAAE